MRSGLDDVMFHAHKHSPCELYADLHALPLQQREKQNDARGQRPHDDVMTVDLLAQQ